LLAAVPARAQKPATASAAPLTPTALAARYCVYCHNAKTLTAGLSLEGIDFTHPGAHADILERVLRKVRSGEMPPAGMPHPSTADEAAFTKTITDSLDRAAAANPNPGRPAVHRLNRTEYSNAVRDILAVDVQPGNSLPVDDSGYGFDNNGDVLTISPALLEKYLAQARLISRLAVGDASLKPGTEDITVPAAGNRLDRVSDDLPFDSRAGFTINYYFPVDAEYVIRLKLNQGGTREERQAIPAGLHTIGATFLRESYKDETMPGGGGRRGAGAPPPQAQGGRGGEAPLRAELDLRLDGAKLKRFEMPEPGGRPQVTGLSILGPYNATGPGDTPSRARIFTCRPATEKDHPATEKDEVACARTILTTIARRAFRRPVTDADIKPLLSFYQSGRKERDFDYGIEKSLRALLVSPDFLFRVEHDPAGAAPGTVFRIGDFELASRLSFFLWSTIPDDTLLDLAEKGKLHEPAVLHQQVRRMLDDARSDSLISNFAGQWLYTRALAQEKPDPDAFPEFDESLRRAFEQETELLFQTVLREDRPVMELLDAKYTFLNQRLAEHYKIPNVYGSQFRRVELTDANRGGLLGQGSILTVTSYPNRTSVVQRGKWILDNLLGSPPPPPPANVPSLEAHAKDGRPLTMREQMEVHRADPICASCHARMDPIGFALENFDGVGHWRDKDAGSAINASGKLPNGQQFSGPAGLKKLLTETPSYRDQFEATVTRKLLTYALGRGLEYYDEPSVRAILRETGPGGYKMDEIITAIVDSKPFQMRRTLEP
jgi:hypothetical protein